MELTNYTYPTFNSEFYNYYWSGAAASSTLKTAIASNFSNTPYALEFDIGEYINTTMNYVNGTNL